MAKVREEFDVTIGQHFLTVIHNADISGLSEEDLEAFENFQADFDGPGVVFGMPEEGEESSFMLCDITGEFSDCYTITVTVFEEEKGA